MSFLFQHLFSAILNRDQAYQSILDQGMILGLPWGTDIEGRGRGRERGGGGGAGERNSRNSSPSLANQSGSQSPDEGEEPVRED